MAGALYMVSLILIIHPLNGVNASLHWGKLMRKQVSIKVYFFTDQNRLSIKKLPFKRMQNSPVPRK